MGKVPINSIPADENVKPWETPLVAAVMTDKEDAALHLLSLAGSEQDLDLGRRLNRGNTVLHHAVELDHMRLVNTLLLYKAPVYIVADSGHTPLSVAVEDYNFDMASSLLDYYYARGQLQEAFKKSFYDHEKKQFISLLHRVSSRDGRHAEAGMLCIAQFLIEQGADVGVRNDGNQTPADVALSRCGFPFLHLILPQCGAPLLYQYLRHVEDGLFGEDKVFTALYDRASSPLHGTAYFAWILSACVFFLLGRVFTRDERAQRKKIATEEAARKLAFEEEQESRKKKQQGKDNKKKDKCTTLQEARPPLPDEDKGEVTVAPTEVKKESNKKMKNKKPGRPPRELQEIVETAATSGGDVKEEDTDATTLQVPVREQQVLSSSAPLEEGAQDIAEPHMQALPAAADAAVEDSTSIPSLPLQKQDDDDDKAEEGDDDGDAKEEFGPDKAFVLEGASSILVCPISFKVMTSAVLAMDTQSYQKEALETWVERCKAKGLPLTSPLTNAPMEPQMMINEALRILVDEHIEAREQAWREQLAEKKRSNGGGGR